MPSGSRSGQNTDPIDPSLIADRFNVLASQTRPFIGAMLTASLPASGIVFGTQALITDGAAAPVLGGAATGGGAVKTPVTFIGTGWING